MIKTFVKDPDSVLDYVLNLTEFLADGDTLKTSPLVVDASGITVDSAAVNAAPVTVVQDGQVVTVAPYKGVVIWLSGGAAGASAVVTTRFETNLGRKQDASFKVALKHR